MGITSKIIWAEDQLEYIRSNFGKLTAREMAAYLGVKIQTLRAQYYSMGLKAITMEYWTGEQVCFLKENYRSIGDVELAEIFQGKWPKNKLWTIKHIEKKRNYLGLHRTKQELKAVMKRNQLQGRLAVGNKKRWIKTGVSPEGSMRMWRPKNGRPTPFIKVNGKFIHWARYTWELANGPIPEGMNVCFIGSPEILELSNLQLLSNGELSKSNSQTSSIGLSDNYVASLLTLKNKELRKVIKENYPELIELKKQQLKLNRAIKNGTTI